MKHNGTLEKFIVPVVEGLGLEWVGLQYFPQGKRSILRIYIDNPTGVTAENCEQVSRQVEGILGVEDVIKGEYTLEVSSPGIDRVLFTPTQCERYVGKVVSVRLAVPREGKRNFKGTLKGVVGNEITLLADERECQFLFTDIDEARLVPEW